MHRPHPLGRRRRDHAAAEDAQEADGGAEGDAQAVGRGRGGVPAALVVHHPDRARSVPEVKDKAWVRNPIDNFVLAELEKRGLTARAGGRSPHARPAARARPDRPAARPGRRRGVRQRQVRELLREVRRQAAGDRRTGASTAAATGSTTPATATRTASTSTTSARSGRTATGSSTPSTRTSRSTSSPSSNSPATCCRTPTLDQRIATGFNRCNITTSEGGAIDEEYLVLYARDRTETTSPVWMGLTDRLRGLPRPQVRSRSRSSDFYSLSAFFNNTTQNAMDGNVHNTPPIIPVPRAEDRAAVRSRSRRTWTRSARSSTARKADGEAGVRQVAGDRDRRERRSARTRSRG